MTLTTSDFLGLSDWVYQNGGLFDDPNPPAPGTGVDINGIHFQVVLTGYNPDTGYAGAVLFDSEDNVLVIVNRGSQQIEDLAVIDQIMATENINNQWPAAKKLAEDALAYAAKYKITSVYSTGHSLGGTLTELQCAQFGLTGVTFNAYGAYEVAEGLPQPMIINPNADITNYRELYDVVSDVSTHISKVVTVANEGEIPFIARSKESEVSPWWDMLKHTNFDLLKHIYADHGIINFEGSVTDKNEGKFVFTKNILDEYNDKFARQQVAIAEQAVKYIAAGLAEIAKTGVGVDLLAKTGVGVDLSFTRAIKAHSDPDFFTSLIENYRTMFDLVSASSTHFGNPPVTVLSKLDLQVLQRPDISEGIVVDAGLGAMTVIDDHGIANFTNGALIPNPGDRDYQQYVSISEEQLRMVDDALITGLETALDISIHSGDLNPAEDVTNFFKDGHATDLKGIKAIIPHAGDLLSGALDGADGNNAYRQALVSFIAMVLKGFSSSARAMFSLWKPGSDESKLERKPPAKSGGGRRLAMAMGVVAVFAVGCDSTPPPKPVKAQLNPNAHEVTTIDLWIHSKLIDDIKASASWEPRHPECAPIIGIAGYYNIGPFNAKAKVQRFDSEHYRLFILEDQFKKGKCGWENGGVGIELINSGKRFSEMAFVLEDILINKKISVFCSAPKRWVGSCYAEQWIKRKKVKGNWAFDMIMEVKK